MTEVSLTRSLPQRIAEKIRFSPDGCWHWAAALNAQGYGYTRLAGHGSQLGAHRVVWLLLRGPIPEGLHLDHLCRVRRCVNPAHLRAVTCRENVLAPGSRCASAVNARKAHCPHGHPYDEDNTFVAGARGGKRYRQCKTCLRAYKRRPHVMARHRARARRRYHQEA